MKARGGQIYRALYHYEPRQSDELALQKDELYSVMEKCKDGWYKGTHLTTLKAGVFPGNYVIHVDDSGKALKAKAVSSAKSSSSLATSSAKPSSSSSAASSSAVVGGDLIDFSRDMAKVFLTTQTTVPPNVSCSKVAADRKQLPADQSASVGEKFLAVEDFPANNEYELDLRKGDVLVVVKQRPDGWCKGFHLLDKSQQHAKTGLFPSSFVHKM